MEMTFMRRDGTPIVFDSESLDLYELGETEEYEAEDATEESEDALLVANIPFFRIALTESCNLRCPGCFVIYQPKQTMTMTEETLRHVMEWTFQQSKGLAPVYHFFGGEPLIKFDLIKLSVELANAAYCAKLIEKPVFAITTNATLVNQEILEVFRENDFKVGVSIDGDPEIHDEARPFENGTGSYAIARKNYLKMYEAGIDTHVLITPHTRDYEKLIAEVAKVLECFPMNTLTINTPFKSSLLEWDLDGFEYAKALVEIWRIAEAFGVAIECALTPILAALSTGQRREKACAVLGDSSAVSISPSGEVSSCTQTWQNPKEVNVKDRKFYPECSSCFALGYCGGPCPVHYGATKRMDLNRCRFMRTTMFEIVKNLEIFEGSE